jgi:structural maintenance of chromosome 2
VQVAFGKVWKQSLLELSGGQRSLVALSLVLSLLRFKPAPVYILDEIDAALDLSHTQARRAGGGRVATEWRGGDGGARAQPAQLPASASTLHEHYPPFHRSQFRSAPVNPPLPQNIGAMIKSHFQQSQFLVVSLKEGMFSNANVLFRTKFVDGVSTIARSVPSAAARAAAGVSDEADGAAGKGKAASAGRKALTAIN